MLRELRIKNFVLIDTLELEFQKGLNVLTGETGAGKSILIDALGLVLGEKVSEECLKKGEDTCEVEAKFSINGMQDAFTYLENAGINAEDEAILRRIITRASRNRCFINGVSVTLSFLKQFGNMLVDIHGQHDHQTLLTPESQIKELDSFAGIESRVISLERKNLDFKKLKKKLLLLRERDADRIERNKMLMFQLKEITESGLSVEEENKLKKEKTLLQNAEKRNLLAREAYEMLYDCDGAAQEKLNTALSRLEDILSIDNSLKNSVDELKGALYTIDDISINLRDYLDKVQFDPDRLLEIDDRLAEINNLKRKYGQSIEYILEKKESIERELSELDDITEKIGSLDKQLACLRNEISKDAIELAIIREKNGKKIVRQIEQQLKDLSMKNVRFETNFTYEEDKESFVFYKEKNVKLYLGGIGKMEFYFSANVGEDLKPLSRIASGGELSRVMLAIKNVMAGKGSVPVLIFDEIDAGIGGGVADIVGKKIKKVAQKHQVFCVTHLPQIASKADIHFSIKKNVKGNKTTVTVKELAKDARVEEIARMAGGMVITDTTRRHAEEMIDNFD